MKRLLLAGVWLLAPSGMTSALAADIAALRTLRRRAHRPTCRSSPGMDSTSASMPATASDNRTGPRRPPSHHRRLQRQRPADRRHDRLQCAARLLGLRDQGRCRLGQHQGLKPRPTASAPARPPNSWLGTARGRLGYAFDRFLPFSPPAWPSAKSTAPSDPARDLLRNSGRLDGRARASNTRSSTTGPRRSSTSTSISARNCNAACSGGAEPFDVTFTTSIVRGGVNYKF